MNPERFEHLLNLAQEKTSKIKRNLEQVHFQGKIIANNTIFGCRNINVCLLSLTFLFPFLYSVFTKACFKPQLK